MKMLSLSDIEQSYNGLMTAKELLHKKTEAEISSKEILATKKAELLMSGAIIGKNAETRDAQLAEGCKDETNQLRIAETEKREASLKFELASITVNMHRDMLRLMEIESQ
jgi:hypothetical protein